MKKIFLISCIIFCFGFYSYNNTKILPEDDLASLYLGDIGKRWSTISTYANGAITSISNFYQVCTGDYGIELISSGNLTLKPLNKIDSQIVMYLPIGKNGKEKIKCSVWFNPITKTLKASPVNNITCGGFE